jgi:hypothetical protein
VTRPPRASLAAAVLTTALLLGGCASSAQHAQPTQTITAHTTTTATHSAHLAPDLEAALPARVDGTALERVSTTGAAIFGEFGGTAWAKQMTAFLTRIGKTPADLRYAQAWDPSQNLNLDGGVFEIKGVSAATLAAAILNSSHPDQPGLATSATTIAGRPVTVAANPSTGSTLYLYQHADLVFYAGSDDTTLITQYLRALP